MSPSAGIITVRSPDLEKVLDDISRWDRNAVGRLLEQRIRKALKRVQLRARSKYLSGPPSRTRLGWITGELRQSVGRVFRIRRRGPVIEGEMGTSGTPHAAIHEYGGIIRPRRAEYLKFRTRGGQWVTTRRVRMPARPYLSRALEDELPSIEMQLGGALDRIARSIAKRT